jgi:hypothetical protein
MSLHVVAYWSRPSKSLTRYQEVSKVSRSQQLSSATHQDLADMNGGFGLVQK